MTDQLPADTLRSVDLVKTGPGRYEATNRHGVVLPIGYDQHDTFSPVELMLAALGGCSAIDVDLITGKRTDPTSFRVRTEGHKAKDEQGNHLVDLTVTFEVTFPEGEDGDRARALLPRALQQTRDRLCTVGRTIAIGEPIEYVDGLEEA